MSSQEEGKVELTKNEQGEFVSLAVTMQPVSVEISQQVCWMPSPGPIPGISEGFEYLVDLDQLIILQEFNILEAIPKTESCNRYKILNNQQQQVYLVCEESGYCDRLCFGASRGLILHFTDSREQEVFTIVRDFRFCTECCWFADNLCIYPMRVMDRQGRKLGSLRMVNSKCYLRFGVYGEDDEFLYEIFATSCGFRLICFTYEPEHYPICKVGDEIPIGDITKGDYSYKDYIMTDMFGLAFPRDLPITHKILMVAGVFLINYSVYEWNKPSTKN